MYLGPTFILLLLLSVALLVLLGFFLIILHNLVLVVSHLAKIVQATLLFALLATLDIFYNRVIVFQAALQDTIRSEVNAYGVIVAVLNASQLLFVLAA